MRCHVQFNGDIFAPAWLQLARCSAGLRILISAQWRIQQASQIAASSLRLEDMRVLMKADQTLIVKTYWFLFPVKCVIMNCAIAASCVDYFSYMCNSLDPAKRSDYSYDTIYFKSGIRMF